MSDLSSLQPIAIVIVVGAVISTLFARLRLPAVTGLIFAGALVGPQGFRLVEEQGRIQSIAELGVVALLFTIGLELSLVRLGRIARLVALSGLLQVGLTTAAVAAIAHGLAIPIPEGIFWGFVLSLSSTAIVLRGLAERGEVDAPHGRFVVGALLFQDLSVVPMVLLVPLLAARGAPGTGPAIALALGKAVVVVAATVLVARYAVPRLFALVDAGRSRESFILSVVGICVGTAWITSSVGLSLELGAFLAGLVLADTDFGKRALGDVLPLRDVLTSIFFVSLGMLFDPAAIGARPLAAALLLGAILVGKSAIATLAALVMRFPARAAFLAGVGLAQFSEFGFVLVGVGQAAGLVAPENGRLVLAVGVISMLVTPIAMRVAPHLSAGQALLRPLERLLGARGMDEPAPEHSALVGHVVIVGFGPAGRILAAALGRVGLPYLVLELNAETVRRARSEGEPIYYGDATTEETLEHARVRQARLVVLVINDPKGARLAVPAIKRFAPDVPVLLRCRYLSDRESLLELGASDIVTMELEAGVEIVARVLRDLSVARNVIEESIRLARAATQESARKLTIPRFKANELEDLADLKLDAFLVRSGAHAAGRALNELRLRETTGALVVAVRRGGGLLEDPDPGLALAAGDTLYIVGPGPARRSAIALLETGTTTQGERR